MSDRREFLITAGGALSAATVRALPQTPEVRAVPSVFYGFPDEELNLVRFHARTTSAPAGRLRVFDPAGRLLGTAGMLPVENGLFGELWLRAPSSRRIRTDLEVPSRRGIVRSWHTVRPGPRWDLRYVALVEHQSLEAMVDRSDPVSAGVLGRILSSLELRVDPVDWAGLADVGDHVDLLDITVKARELAAALTLPSTDMSRWDGAAPLSMGLARALRGAGVKHLLIPHQSKDLPGGTGYPRRWILPSTTRSSGDLGWRSDFGAMVRRTEMVLTSMAPEVTANPTLLVLDAKPPREGGRLWQMIEKWNGTYSFPRITLGDPADLTTTLIPAPGGTYRPPSPGSSTIPAKSSERNSTSGALETLGRLAGESDDPLRALAQSIDRLVPGTVVFNTSPYPRSDIVELDDGEVMSATDVPPLGYAFFPRTKRTWHADPPRPGTSATTPQGTVTVNPGTGSFQYLEAGAARSDRGITLNGIEGATLEESFIERIPEISTRITTLRALSDGGRLRSRCTIYADLPWIELSNELEDSPLTLEVAHRAPFGIEGVDWDLPLEVGSSAPPVEISTYLRWLAVYNRERSLLISADPVTPIRIRPDGTLSTFVTGQVTYRLESGSGLPSQVKANAFGWASEPLVIARAPGTGGTFPRFGSLVKVERPGAEILRVHADSKDSVILYIREILGLPGDVIIHPDLIEFGRALEIDLGRRVIGNLEVAAGRARFFLRPFAVAAVKLTDVRLLGS